MALAGVSVWSGACTQEEAIGSGLSRLKVEFTASADGTGSKQDNMRMSQERLRTEEALFHQAEKETGIVVSSDNITTHALGRQAPVNVTDQSKRCAKATFSL